MTAAENRLEPRIESQAEPHAVRQPVVPEGGASASQDPPAEFDRRSLMIASGIVAAGAVVWPLAKRLSRTREKAFVAANQRYDGELRRTIADGLQATGIGPGDVRGKKVLLKPNLVEPTRTAPQMTTHPAMVVAAAEVLLGWGAEVRVGEAPGHVRDTEMALVESGLGDALAEANVEFVDLNYEDVAWTPNRGHFSRLEGFYFPKSIVEADFVVSMPKLKTHHWAGITVSMKNLYGTLPGIKYGWPKNVLHHAGIPETVVDINASLPRTLAIVDGITCMEGDGPIMGSPKEMGLVVIGGNLPAVDATCARLMKIDPAKIGYLKLASGRLGPLEDWAIEQHGEAWRPLAQPFHLLDEPHLKDLRARGELTS